MAHKEAPECIKSINQVLRTINEDLESELVSLSISTADPNKNTRPRVENHENNLMDINCTPSQLQLGVNTNEIPPLSRSNVPHDVTIAPPTFSNALGNRNHDNVQTINANQGYPENISYQSLPIYAFGARLKPV